MSGTTLKVILIISQVIIIAAGGIILYFTLTQLNGYKDLWQYIDVNVNKYAMYVMCGFGGLTILTGLVGFIGVLKRNRCLLTIFNILAIILCAVFIAIGVFITIFTNNQYQDLKNISNCNQASSDYDWLKETNNFYNLLGEQFCTNLCKCYVSNKDDFPANTFNSREIGSDSTLPVQFQQCAIAKLDTQYNSYIPLVQFFENKFECSGVCDAVPFYVFTDINRGPPTYTEGCKQRVQAFYDKYGNLIKILAFSIGGFLFLQIIFAIWLCCMKKDNGDRDMYQRIYN